MDELLEALAMAADAILHPFSTSRSKPRKTIAKIFVAFAILAVFLIAIFTLYNAFAPSFSI